jgi:Pyruvate phosphate dikinase, AMP/ATP-binding domain
MGNPRFVNSGAISLAAEGRRTMRLVCGLVLAVLGVVPGLAGAQPVDLCEYGKTDMIFPDDPFEHRQYAGTSNLGWVKFTLLNPPYDPNIVYFQDSEHFSFHYDFVSECLGPFEGTSPEEFDRLSLHADDQQLILGAVITPPTGFGVSAPIQEYGIQFVRYDPYSREELAALFHQVAMAISSDPNVQAYYFPSYEQSEVARKNAEWFAEQGIPISSAARWTRGNTIYSEGWALGRLKYVAPDDIDSAYSRGELLASDILLTDAVPAEIPVLAGVITLTPSTPNSHVAILANTYAIPFVHLTEDVIRRQALELEGRRVVLRAYASAGFINAEPIDVQLVDANDTMTDEQAAEFLTLKQPPELDIQAVESLGRYSASVDSLEPNDIRYFGGKAANYSILRRAIPENTRIAMAFSFDLWNGFLDQMLASGRTLREEIDLRLSAYTFPPVSAAALEHELEQIRELFKDDEATHFSPVLEGAVIAALTDSAYGFDPDRKLRFRSSTNVEDSEYFSGAGLYDSYSGCLADDLDGDDSGPSHCDPEKSKERGVFRAIRKVFASFYNENAFLERLRHGLSEDKVGMAVLVHHSFPDEIELANGVAVLEVGAYSTSIEFATQEGAVSVANPEPGLIPEEVRATVSFSSDEIYLRLGGYSNLVPLGQTVMAWKNDYEDLARLLVQAATQYEQDTDRTPHQLDFEYKKIAPTGELVVKQIRPIPRPSTDAAERRFLAGGSIHLSVFQGEHAEVLASHRLKSNWQLTAGSRWLAPEDLSVCLYEDAVFEYQDEGQIWTMSGSPASWPEALHEIVTAEPSQGFEVTDAWTVDHLENARRYMLTSKFVANGVVPDNCPVLFLSDLAYALEAEYTEPVFGWDWNGEVTSTTTDQVSLVPVRLPDPDDLLQTRTMDDAGITIETSFYWPPVPTGPTAGYTAPLIRWVQTTITGLTAVPFTLTGDYSQTYEPGHHNFYETFLFEPRLESDLSQDTLDELRVQGIDMIVVSAPRSGEATIVTYDLTDTLSPGDSVVEEGL